MRALSRDLSVPPLAYTVQQAASALALGASTVYELVASGALKSVRIGRRVVVPVDECAAFLKRQAEQ